MAHAPHPRIQTVGSGVLLGHVTGSRGTTFQHAVWSCQRSESFPMCFVVSVPQNMSLSCFYNPHCGTMMHANGHGEVWTDWNSTSKFIQYGWRCTTNEDAYSNKTLMGNWNEERFDIRKIVQPKPLPSQVAAFPQPFLRADKTLACCSPVSDSCPFKIEDQPLSALSP